MLVRSLKMVFVFCKTEFIHKFVMETDLVNKSWHSEHSTHMNDHLQLLFTSTPDIAKPAYTTINRALFICSDHFMETHKMCILIILQAFETLLKFAWDFIETLLMFHSSTTCHKGFLAHTDNQSILWCASVWNAKWAWPNFSCLFDDLGIRRSWFIWCLTIYTRYKYLHISIRCVRIARSMLTKCCH